ncbi:MAG: ArsR family transcriptional regulator [Actinobacteria bacterium]|nr:MAG: ArsR family transcriptional regulator [Actinomycetota bacterium]
MPRDESRRYKNEIYEQFARVGKAVCNAKRLELLDLLLQTDRSVEILAEQAGSSVANVSQHLQVLKRARLVESERDGNRVVYRIADPAVGQILRLVRSFAEKQLAEVGAITREFLSGRGGMEPVDRERLLERARGGDVVVLDVRPAEEYEAGHLPGATSIPLSEIETRLSELPKDKEIVAYCRGPYCVLAVKAVEMLRERGYEAVRLEDGVQEWSERGFPIELPSAKPL